MIVRRIHSLLLRRLHRWMPPRHLQCNAECGDVQKGRAVLFKRSVRTVLFKLHCTGFGACFGGTPDTNGSWVPALPDSRRVWWDPRHRHTSWQPNRYTLYNKPFNKSNCFKNSEQTRKVGNSFAARALGWKQFCSTGAGLETALQHGRWVGPDSKTRRNQEFHYTVEKGERCCD